MLNSRSSVSKLILSGACGACAAIGNAMIAALALSASLTAHAEPERFYTHKAEQGDTLIKIASRFLIASQDWKPLTANNKIANPNYIPVGTGIRIPVSLMRTELVTGKVISQTGSVKANGGESAVGNTVREGDTFKTGDDGFVSIRLADGSILKVQSRSAIRLENTRQLANTGGVGDTVVKLDSGRIETEVAKQKGTGSRYEIRTPTSNMGVRGTVFRAGGDPSGQRALTEVVEGAVGVSSSGQPGAVGLPAGFGTVVEAGKPPSPPITLLPAPDLSGVPDTNTKPDTSIQFPAVDAAQGYRAQVASDAGFTNLVADATAPTSKISVPGLPDGKFFVRVRAIDSNGLEGKDASKTIVVKATPVAPFLSSPAIKEQVPLGETRFEWAATKEAVSYQIQIDRNAKFAAPLVDKRVLATNAFKPEADLAAGEYVWRVASVRANGDIGPFGDAQPFTVRDATTKLDIPKVKGGEARFSWGGQPGQTYQFQLSRNDRFTDIAADRLVDNGEIAIEGLSKNVYYIRVRAIDKQPANTATEGAPGAALGRSGGIVAPASINGFKGPWSETQQVEIYSPQWWLLMFGLPAVLI